MMEKRSFYDFWRYGRPCPTQTISFFVSVVQKGDLKEDFAVIGTARRPWSDEHYREVVIGTIKELSDSQEQAETFASHFYYQSHDVTDTSHYDSLKDLAETLDQKYHLEGNQIFT